MAIDRLLLDDGSILNSKLMELSMENQRVIANNLANADTPGYTRFALDYQKKLGAALQSGDIDNVQNFKSKPVEDHSNPANLDGNNVVVAQEMTSMMENSVFYSLISKAFNTKMSILKSSIKTE